MVRDPPLAALDLGHRIPGSTLAEPAHLPCCTPELQHGALCWPCPCPWEQH